jgi:hypothetical protein
MVGLSAHRLENMFIEKLAVEGQRTQHDAVHTRPSDQRRSCSLMRNVSI